MRRSVKQMILVVLVAVMTGSVAQQVVLSQEAVQESLCAD